MLVIEKTFRIGTARETAMKNNVFNDGRSITVYIQTTKCNKAAVQYT